MADVANLTPQFGYATSKTVIETTWHCPCGCDINLTMNPDAKRCLGCERPIPEGAAVNKPVVNDSFVNDADQALNLLRDRGYGRPGVTLLGSVEEVLAAVDVGITEVKRLRQRYPVEAWTDDEKRRDFGMGLLRAGVAAGLKQVAVGNVQFLNLHFIVKHEPSPEAKANAVDLAQRVVDETGCKVAVVSNSIDVEIHHLRMGDTLVFRHPPMDPSMAREVLSARPGHGSC